MTALHSPNLNPTTMSKISPKTENSASPISLDTMGEADDLTHNDTCSHNRDECGHDNGDDAASETSTVTYEHEPFDSFQHKVTQLTTTVFPDVNPSCITIERMKGGSFNRVVGVKICDPAPKKFSLQWLRSRVSCLTRNKPVKVSEKFIVRIPRYDADGMDSLLTIMEFVQPRLSFPVPVTTSFDLSSDNALGKAYLVQRRLRGEQLSRIWDTLNLAQKLSVVKQVSELHLEIANITSPCAGSLVVASKNPLGTSPKLETFAVPRLEHDIEDNFPHTHTSPAVPQTPLGFLLKQGERWREYQTAEGACFDEIWDGFARISNGLYALGFLPDDDVFHLAHGDLEGYNMMAVIVSDSEVEITGVLDWDMAVFAPLFMFKAPFWMWTSDDEDVEEEATALIEPETEEGKSLKKAFVEMVGEKWSRFAFSPEAVLARRMFPILQNGVFSSGEMMEAEAIIEEWNELHPEEKGEDEDSGSESDEENEGEDVEMADEDVEANTTVPASPKMLV